MEVFLSYHFEYSLGLVLILKRVYHVNPYPEQTGTTMRTVSVL
jgi:hypothetical protein